MSWQHCENYDVKRETVHCYPRNVDRCCTWSERVVEGGLMLSQESQRIFQNLLLFCFVLLYNKSLDDWSLGKQLILFPSNLNVSLDFVSGNIEILGKHNSLFPSGPVIKCLIVHSVLLFEQTTCLCFYGLNIRHSSTLTCFPNWFFDKKAVVNFCYWRGLLHGTM